MLSESVLRKPRKDLTEEHVGLNVLGYLLKKLRRPEDFMTVALLSLENKMKEARKWAVFQSWSAEEGLENLRHASLERLQSQMNEMVGF